MARITIVIKKGGVVESTVNGVHGPNCAALLDELLSGLGEELESTPTSEFYETETETVTEGW